ncbi:MAG: PAS domain S-box protein [Nitrospirae bacterium]|nr:PAS domain S-box protein [Nitrospirota bacterium]
MNRPAFTQQIRFGLITLFCLLVLVTESVEYQFFEHLKTKEKTFAGSDLASIGQLKAGQLAAFLKERRGDSLVFTDLLHIGLTQGWWDTKDKDLPALLQQPLQSVVTHYDYSDAIILDAKGNVRFHIGKSTSFSEPEKSLVQQVLQTAPPPFSELYATDPTAPEHLTLDTFAPIRSLDKKSTVGVLVLRGDWPDLFTMIQAWPVESRTAETLVIKRDRSHVVLLNELRHKTQTQLKPHMPIQDGIDAPPWPTIKAAQGQYGPLESVDHRGQAVLAHILPVQGTPWSLVVKIDTGEVLEHLQIMQQLAAAGTLIAAIGIGLWGYNWQRRREQDRVRHEAQRIEHRLAAIIDSAMDAIISVDEDQHIVLFNPTAERLFRCTAQEALGQPIDRFIPHRFRNAHHEHIRSFGLSDKTTRKMGKLGAVSGLRTDGEEFPIEASVSQARTDGQTLYTVILRDISLRRLTEAALTQSEERLRLALAAANQGLYDLNVQTGACIVSQEYALMLGYDPAEFRETNEAWRERLHPDDREKVYRVYADYVAGRCKEYRVEFRQRTKSGGWKWILSIGRLVAHSADGQPLRMLGTHTDITERKQAEDRLAEAHTMLNLVLDNIPLYVFWKDRTSTYLGGNTLFAQAAGVRDPQALTGKTDFDLAWKNLAELYRADDRTVMETHTPKLNFEESLTTPDGNDLCIRTSKVPLENQEGTVFGVLGIFEDITERKQAEQALRISEEQLREAQRIALIGSWELDLTTAALSWSAEIFRIFEIDPTQFGASYEAFLRAIHPEDRARVNAAYTTSIQTREPYEIVHRLRMADGRIKYVQERCQTFYDATTGTPIRSTGTVQDITELKKTEIALTQSETLFRTLATMAPVGIFRTDPAGQCTYVNEPYCEISGRTPEATLGSGWAAALHPEDLARVVEEWQHAIQNRVPFASEFRIQHPNGQTIWVFVRARAETDSGGDVLGYVGTVTDISERKQNELRTETSLHEKETLLREVHHRVKNNLQIISSLLHFQAKKAQDGHEQSIFTEGQNRLRSMILVHELLYRSTDLHCISLGEYLTMLTDQLRHSYREAATRLQLQVEACDLSVPASIALPCGMIVTELVTNAFKYAYPANQRGPLCIRIAMGEGVFRLSVSDEGIGLPTTFDLTKASSFGLQLVTNLAGQLGATLTREPGHGTTIALEIPLPSGTMDPTRQSDNHPRPFHTTESLT